MRKSFYQKSKEQNVLFPDTRNGLIALDIAPRKIPKSFYDLIDGAVQASSGCLITFLTSLSARLRPAISITMQLLMRVVNFPTPQCLSHST